MTPRKFILTIALLAVACAGATAQPHAAGRLSPLDKDYLKDTAQSNLEEVQLEPVVRSHAASAADKQFAIHMHDDHARANADLKKVAARVHFTLPRDISEDQRHIVERLSQFHGAGFAPVYKREMIDDHTGDIAKTRRELSLGSNPVVIAAAQKNLALLQHHLQMAQALPDTASR